MRALFGGDPMLTETNGIVRLNKTSRTLTFYDAETGGTQVTDLLAADGTTAITTVTTTGAVVPPFYGPDGVVLLWADAGDGNREPMRGAYSTSPKTDAELNAAFVGRVLPSSAPDHRSTATHATQTIFVRGLDATDGRLLATNTTNGTLNQSADWGATWSSSKTLPADVAYNNVSKLVRFGSYIYMLGKATSDGLVGIWRAAPAAGNTAFSWSGRLMTWTAGAGTLTPCLNAGTDYLYAADYGDPTGGPRAYRLPLAAAESGDGTAWETIYGPEPTLRHIHAIAPDPYNPGHVWMTGGDGTNKTWLHSTDHGATWTVAVASSQWQAVQISFTPDYVWGAGDSQRVTAMVIDRDTYEIRSAGLNHHMTIAVPGGATGDKFYSNAYYGAVDPATGIYYCAANDPSTGNGNTDGLFCLPYLGAQYVLLEPGLAGGNNMNGEVFVGGGYVFSGKWRRVLLTI